MCAGDRIEVIINAWGKDIGISMSDPTVNFSIQARQVQFAIPSELIKKNLKNIQKLVEKLKKQVAEELSQIKKKPNLTAQQKLQLVRKLIKSHEAFQKKLKTAIQKDEDYRQRLVSRGKHIGKLGEMCISNNDSDESNRSLDDTDKVLDLHNEKLINWFRKEANLLIVDYMLKSNTRRDTNTGIEIMKGIASSFGGDVDLHKLIDYDVYESFNRVFISIEDHELAPVSAWYNENKNALKKFGSNLQFEIHYCKYLSMIEHGDVSEAIQYCKQYLTPYGSKTNYAADELINFDGNLKRLTNVGAPLVYVSMTVGMAAGTGSKTISFDDFNASLAEERWKGLSQCFTDDFTKIFAIPKTYPLLIYLAAGLSSLKTKSCYCNDENSIFGDMTPPFDESLAKQCLHSHQQSLVLRGPNVYNRVLKNVIECPVCSPELYQLSQSLPYAQLITSIFPDPYMLPNGNIYSYERLQDAEIVDNLGKRYRRDPLTLERFDLSEGTRVYPA